MQPTQHTKAWHYLRKLALSLGGSVVYVRHWGERGYQFASHNPGDRRFAVAWRDKTVYCLFLPQEWPRLMHELAHIFAALCPPHEVDDDCTLLGWEFATLRAMTSAANVPYEDAREHWLLTYGARGIDFERESAYFADMDDLRNHGSPQTLNDFVADQITNAQIRGLVSLDGQPQTLRT
jgi:hypothetical protein